VLIENRPAIEVMRMHDRPDTLHFVDPTYVHDTRQMGSSKKTYRHEMSDVDHVELIEALQGLVGMVIVCGYACELYDTRLASWKRVSTEARISAGRGTEIRTEVMWLNPACSAALDLERAGERLL
jgi:DNA adenine methylase